MKGGRSFNLHSMICPCENLPDFTYYIPGRSLSRKLRPITEPVQKENWRELVRCKVCGTFWRIDAQDKYQTRFVWRVGVLRPDWASVDFEEKQKALLLDRRGGETAETCAWIRCDRRKVNGVAYCIDHLYATGARW